VTPRTSPISRHHAATKPTIIAVRAPNTRGRRYRGRTDRCPTDAGGSAPPSSELEVVLLRSTVRDPFGEQPSTANTMTDYEADHSKRLRRQKSSARPAASSTPRRVGTGGDVGGRSGVMRGHAGITNSGFAGSSHGVEHVDTRLVSTNTADDQHDQAWRARCPGSAPPAPANGRCRSGLKTCSVI